jgi:hypothetical protein
MGTGALRGCSSLTSINLSQTQITVLNNQMFYGNTSLSSILLPLDLTSFADDTYIFYQCNVLTSIQIPVGVTTLPTGLFSRATALTSVRIPTSFDLAAWTDILATAGYTGTIIRV